MKKLIALFTLLLSLQANAGLIEIEVSNTDVNVGESINITLNASGFDSSEAFDFFNLDVIFNNTLFDYVEGSLTSELDIFGLVASENSLGLGIGFASLFEVTDSDFVLASFSLTAIGQGVSNIGLAINEFESFVGGDIDTIDAGASVGVSATKVPEPGTLGLFGLALAGLVGLRRKAA